MRLVRQWTIIQENAFNYNHLNSTEKFKLIHTLCVEPSQLDARLSSFPISASLCGQLWASVYRGE